MNKFTDDEMYKEISFLSNIDSYHGKIFSNTLIVNSEGISDFTNSNIDSAKALNNILILFNYNKKYFS